ncbi:hypothetical protein T439DRAFT_311762 [Meredithblackwellia eburnea MCA 4105]
MDLGGGKRKPSITSITHEDHASFKTQTQSPYIDSAPMDRSPRLGSARVLGTPRIGASPRIGGDRRGSQSSFFGGLSPSSPAPTQGLWSYLYRGPSRTPGLPGHHRRGLTGGYQSPTRVQIILNIILRPLYILSRRGPLLPIAFVIIMFIFFLSFSTNSHSQSVTKRVQKVVRPYIPNRAAAAFNWRPSKQKPLKVGDGALGTSDGVDDEEAVMKPAPAPAKAWVLPPPRKDKRMMLEEGEKHPIPLLMLRARKKWEQLKANQSKTFKQAVAEYVKRNGRRPPRGFDQWYAFAKAHKVLLIDEFDLISNDLKVFHAFKPSTFRDRVANLAETFDVTWTIRMSEGKILREGPLKDHNRAVGVEDLIERFAHQLPDMTIIYNGHDGARVAITHEERMRLENLAKEGKYDTSEAPFWPIELGPEPHHSIPVFCPPDSLVRAEGFDYGWPDMESTGFEMPPLAEGAIGSVLDDFVGYMDVCNSPQYRHFHCTTSWVYQHHPTAVLPLFTPGVQRRFGDIHALIVEQLDLFQEHDPTWEERPFTSLQWRGQTSGPLWESKTPWKTTQRARLHLLSHQESGSRKIVITDENDVMRSVEVPNYRLNPLFLDAGMIGPAVQCVKEDGTCDKMNEVFQGYDKRISFDRASLYKYVLDVDGNSWSGRFRRLMMSNAAVVKATIFPEFWSDWAIPWLHFIPIQVDYSDMWDVMAFFRGGLNGEGAHDALGKEIADAGKEWVRECFRYPDLEAYQYRLMLEYGRLYNDETSPGSNDFNGDEDTEPVWDGTIVLEP